MAEQLLRGAPASPGVAIGTVWRPRAAGAATASAGARIESPEHELGAARAALTKAADALEALGATLPDDEAEIVRAGVLMAGDPALTGAVRDAILVRGLPAPAALLEATEQLADAIAAIDDETLAARADDVRSLGRRAASLTVGAAADVPPDGAVLVDRDVGPADIAEFAHALSGVALVGGGTTAHAAIVARSLGVPMVTGLPAEALALPAGTLLAVDGADGTIIIEPSPDRARGAEHAMAQRRAEAERAAADREEPAVTCDGTRIAVLANVASAAELEVALRAGAEGVGLLRTELAFLDAHAWPTEDQHVEALAPIIGGAEGRPVIVRVLDIGPDKCPPFARNEIERGIALLLEHADALTAQLRAIVRCARGHDVRIMLPMVEAAEQVTRVRALLHRALPLGAMVETAQAARRAGDLASVSDFLSIGTNDLTASILGVDRFASSAPRADDPAVLAAIARTVSAGRAAAIPVEVCGEAASDERMLPLLLGLGVEQVSVGGARVGAVRGWIRALSLMEAERLAASAQVGDGGAERVERGGGVHALGA